MRLTLALLVGLLVNSAYSQENPKASWELSSALSLGSENNMGHYGFGLTNRLTYHFYKSLSASAEFMVFSELPGLNPSHYSAVSGGMLLNHTATFKEGKRFVRVSAGVAYLGSASWGYGSQDGNNGYPALLMNLEGGGNVSNKVTMGLTLSTFSAQIFGEILMMGMNFAVRPW